MQAGDAESPPVTPFLFEGTALPATHTEEAAVPVTGTAADTNVALEVRPY
jgi:hypothetical protein